MFRCGICFFHKCTVIFEVISPQLVKLLHIYLFLVEIFLITFRDGT